MKKIFIIIVVVLVLGLAGFGIYKLVGKKQINEESLSLKLQNIVSDHVCEIKVEDTDDYTEYYIENIEVKDNRVIKTQGTSRLECFDKEKYDRTKAQDFGSNVVYDDKNFIILYDLSESNDYTVNDNNEEIILNYEDYKASLETAGYVCK